MEETGRPAALVETISGSLAVTVPPGKPALAITLDLALDGARDMAQAMGPVLELAQVLETGRDLDRVVLLALEMGRHRVVEAGLVLEAGLDLGRVLAPGRAAAPGQVVETGRDSERVVVPAGAAELAPAAELVRAVELVPAHTPEQSRPEWVGGSPPRHC